jgi:hypothetical protein
MWFRRVKKKNADNPAKDAVARMIAGRLAVWQQATVKWLERIERRCTVRQKKILLLSFCLGCGIYWCFTLTGMLFKGRGATLVSFGHISPVAQPPPYDGRKDSVHHDTSFNQPFKNNK